MKKIDDQLGGTTPLNIILNFPVKKINNQEEKQYSGKNPPRLHLSLSI